MNAISKPGFDVQRVRAQFPILSQQVRGKPLVFLDSAASAQKPRAVIDAMVQAMETQYANVHRGLHWMSERTSDAFESTRDAVQRLLNAPSREEIVFAKNTTEAINLVAHSYGRGVMTPGQAVVITEMEHHANLVPWQMLRDATGIELRVAAITDAGELDMASLEHHLADGRVGLVAVTHMSNVLGTVTPAARISALAHAQGARVLFDGSQAVVHRAVDVQAIDADFYVWTGHKLYGPTGIGVLYGKRELLEAMPPFLGGGDMIGSVSLERSTWAEVPHKFEAGTPMISRRSGSRPPSSGSRRSGSTPSRPMRPASRTTRSPGCRPCPACASSARHRTGAACSASRSRARMRTTCPPCSTVRASPSVPATTARSR